MRLFHLRFVPPLLRTAISLDSVIEIISVKPLSELSKAMIGCEPGEQNFRGEQRHFFASPKGHFRTSIPFCFMRLFLCSYVVGVRTHDSVIFTRKNGILFIFYESKIGTDFARGVNSVLEAWESIHGNARYVIQLRRYCPERGYLSDLTVYVCFSNYVPHEYSDWAMCRDMLDFIMRYEVLMAHVCHSRPQAFTNVFNYRSQSIFSFTFLSLF